MVKILPKVPAKNLPCAGCGRRAPTLYCDACAPSMVRRPAGISALVVTSLAHGQRRNGVPMFYTEPLFCVESRKEESPCSQPIR